MGFSCYDTFKIQKKYELSGEGLYSLTNLYLPVIGVDSYSLYLVLNQLNNTEEYTLSKLLDSLNLVNTNILENSFNKLEGIGLIRVLKNKNSQYLFKIILPLTVESFMENHILSNFLKNQIGSIEFNKLIKTNKDNGYTDITKSFDEVYEFSDISIRKTIPSCFKNIVKDNIFIKNDKFDYTLFKLSFDTKFLSPELLDDKSFKEEILKISYHYNLNEEEMHSAVVDAITIDKDLKISDIVKHAQKIYSSKNIIPVNFKTKEADPFIPEKIDDATSRFLEIAENTSCETLLRSITGMKASISELKLLDDLKRQTGFTQGIINIMVLYVVNEKNGTMPQYNYFEKIASNWKRAGIKTSLDALELINKKPEKEEKTSKKGKYKKSVPEWYEDYENKVRKMSNNTVSKEEQEKALEEALASGLFSNIEEK